MWEEVARLAAADSGSAEVLNGLDSVQVVHCLSWPYDDPPVRLAERIGATPGHRRYSGIGGTTPQVLVGAASEAILAGEVDLVLIAGGEALDTARQARKRGERLAWSHRNPEKVPFPLEAPIHPSELAHGLIVATLTFPLFDIARRARLGTGPEPYRQQLGALLAPMTDIAAANPHAWFPVERSADEIITPSTDNRMVAYPYTKYMVAVMDVDMAGALVLTSEERANALGVPRDRRVYPRGWAYGTEVWNIGEREEMWRSQVLGRVAAAALEAADVAIDDVALLDLYSCFTSSVQLARDEVGIAAGDERPLTVTGGLPYAGGPASSYILHSIATMTERLREDPDAHGLVSGVGMHMTKHAFGVYSSRPAPVQVIDGGALQRELDALPRRTVVDVHDGPATVVAYSVNHGRDGAPEFLVAVCELPDGSRCYARTDDADAMASAESDELVGAGITVAAGGDGGNQLVLS